MNKPRMSKLIDQIPQLQKPSSWQLFITGAMVLLLGDHVGAWDVDGWFTTGHMTPADLTALILAFGSLASVFSRGRRGK